MDSQDSEALWKRVKPGYHTAYCNLCQVRYGKYTLTIQESGPHIKASCPRGHFIQFLPQIKDSPKFSSEYRPKHAPSPNDHTFWDWYHHEDDEPSSVMNEEDLERSDQFAIEDEYWNRPESPL